MIKTSFKVFIIVLSTLICFFGSVYFLTSYLLKDVVKNKVEQEVNLNKNPIEIIVPFKKVNLFKVKAQLCEDEKSNLNKIKINGTYELNRITGSNITQLTFKEQDMSKEVEMYIKEDNGCVWKKYDIKFNDYVYKTTIEINKDIEKIIGKLNYKIKFDNTDTFYSWQFLSTKKIYVTYEKNIKEDILYIDDKPLIKILKKVDNSN